jgi:enamidase
MLIANIGLLFSGDVGQPVLDADSILIEGDRITAVGRGLEGSGLRIDAKGCAVLPGLIDNHVHPAFGDWTPRQNQLGWIEAFCHGGVTSMVSAGEVHIPGRPKDPVGVRALAIAAQRCFDAFRPLGVKVLAGAPVSERALGAADYIEMAAAGVRWLGEIGLGSVRDPEEAAQHAQWARAAGLNSMIHCGGPSIAGSNRMGHEAVCVADADIVAHINGGPTSLSIEELTKVMEGTHRAIEIVHNGNPRTALHALNTLREMGALARLVVGTDSPAGSGVQPLGIIRTVSFLASVGGLEPGLAVATATGNISRWRGLEQGVIAAGRPADLVFLDAPIGGAGRDAAEALLLGDIPGIGGVIIDGVARISARSRNTPPAQRIPEFAA